jgi:hypothetical protein
VNYYGDKISPNMTVTPEGYLICQNVPIGRTGWMDYLGQEIPASFGEPTGKVVKVYRSPEELFSQATIASFEGKPATNTHPTANLDVNTAPMTERGHAQNVHPSGEFLVCDLHIRDAGLISEIVNDLKREVSSGYDCSWHKIGDGKYEQREIVGNHVAIVQNGRAGSKVAIHDAKPEDAKPEDKGGRKKMKITQKMLAAIGFKHFAQDAEPEDIAKAMDALKEDEGKEIKDCHVKDEEPKPEPKEEKKEEVKDEAPPKWAKGIMDDIAELKAAQGKKEETKETADSVLDAVEEDLRKEAKDEEETKEEEEKEEAKDALTAGTPDAPKAAADAAIRKFVQDMKPVIMAIPDEAARLEAAKKFRKGIQDARGRGGNGYADILTVVAGNKKAAMDAHAVQVQTVEQRNIMACDAWTKAGENMKGGK